MSALVHAINIGTLAAWLSVSSFGTVGLAVRGGSQRPAEQPADPYDQLETIDLSENFMPDPGDPPPAAPGAETPIETQAPEPEPVEEVPQPPEMPEIAETEPLPEVPDMPKPEAKPRESFATEPKPAPKKEARPTPRRHVAPAGQAQGTPGGTGSPTSNGSGSSGGSRLSGARMPQPSYPSEAKAKGQSGTVIVEFIVGENGSVLSAYAKRPSPWPILNERAVSAVLRWKFKPGPVAKFSRPIIFKLN